MKARPFKIMRKDFKLMRNHFLINSRDRAVNSRGQMFNAHRVRLNARGREVAAEMGLSQTMVRKHLARALGHDPCCQDR